MIAQIFKAFMVTSLVGTVFAGVIIFLKPITKRCFGYYWHYYIWLAVLAVMILPVRFNVFENNKISEMNTPIQHIETHFNNESENIKEDDALDTQIITKTNEKTVIAKTASYFVEEIINNRMNIIVTIWLLGILLTLVFIILGYVRIILKVKKASIIISCPDIKNYTKRNIIVRRCGNLSSPFIMGIFRPSLVLPDVELNSEQFKNILHHEMMHLKRNDIIYKWFAALVRCVHWFNPVVYYIIRQINTECEISCDLAVVAGMNKEEEIGYINTILLLLSNKNKKSIALTTGMTDNKKILKRRFIMIKNKKTTSKVISILSVCLAAVMFSTTIFASGILSGWTADDYEIKIDNYGEIIELTNKPFITNDEVYVPLREMIEKVGYEENSFIKYNDGRITLSVYNDGGNSGMYQMQINDFNLDLMHLKQEDNIYTVEMNDSRIRMSKQMENIPVLKDSKTYITLSDFNYIMYGFLDKRDNDNKLHELTYKIYDKDGNDISDIFNQKARMKYPDSTTEMFFSAFVDKDFEKMKIFCTQNFIDSFFGDGYVFGMKRAKLINMEINDMEYAKSSNDFNIMVTVNMEPDENSVFAPEQTTTSFYVCLLRQSDGKYLINEFATGL